ncbi:MAG: rhodanese-like domain-containing protein [Betaproteobacteria bacterium]|nr:rhodanese-like domain-containing protein [Betaproteobacteria bacterium]
MQGMQIWQFVLDNIWIVVVAFVSGAMLVWPYVKRGSGGPWVSTLQATLMINKQDALLLDIREAPEFEKVHVLHARNIPLAQLDARVGELQKFKSKPIIVHCANGNRSGDALAVLRQKGFENVVNLSGGLAAWQQAGLPMARP